MSDVRRARAVSVVVALTALLAASVVAGVGLGAVSIPPGEVVASILRGLRGVTEGTRDALIWDVRLPRVILAALVGGCLAGAGTVYQALFRNPLADPYILGISSGAGLGATMALVLGAGTVAGSLGLVPAAAFMGAVGTMVLVVSLASSSGRMDTTSLLLAGVAVSYVLAALMSFLMVVARETMASVVFWLMGGLQGASWRYVGLLLATLVVGSSVPLYLSRELNIMLLGDERASQLGVGIERLKYVALASASLLVAAAVSVSGLIGFVGLMTPHMTRLLVGPDHRVLVPASTLLGAIVLVVADLLARVVLAPVELPVGILTALAGGPFFVWLLLRWRRRSGR
ncbi:MAG: iron ABC transporter permease [Coriobacteriia bacterium]